MTRVQKEGVEKTPQTIIKNATVHNRTVSDHLKHYGLFFRTDTYLFEI